MSACAAGLAILQVAGGLITVGLVADSLQRLVGLRKGRVRRTLETESVAKFEVELNYEDLGNVPLTVTLFKQRGRVRVLVMKTELDAVAVERVQDDVAQALGGTIVARSTEAERRLIIEAMERLGTVQSPERHRRTTPPQRESL